MIFLGAIIFLLIILWAFSISSAFGIVLLIIIVVGGISFISVSDSNRGKKLASFKSEFKEVLESIPEFTPNLSYISYDGKVQVAIDDESKQIVIIDNKKGIDFNIKSHTYFKVYSYSDILGSEIIEDGVSITNTSRSSQIGGALIGGVLAGGVGAIIGGLSGSKQTEGNIKRIDLKLVINDINRPLHMINFLNESVNATGLVSKDGFSKSSDIYKDSINQARHWHSLISVIIKKVDDEDKNNEKELDLLKQEKLVQSNNSIADELLKLSDLLKLGVISQEEFDKQKAKLLA